MMSTSIIIPSFKPTTSLVTLIRELNSLGFKDISVINDGSPPDYNSIFESVENLGTRVVLIPNNVGKGDAIKYGIRDFLSRSIDSEFVLFCDDDLQHAPEDVMKVAKLAIDGHHSFVIGERDLSQNIPLKSLIGNNFINFLIHIRHSIKTRDSQSGLRCFNKRILTKLLECSSSRFGFELEALIRLSKINVSPKTVKINTIYHENNRNTRFRPLIDSLRVIWVALKSFNN